ncbi:MAG: hypothetical protein AAF266_13750 [Planctomycetota bacterium]
MTPVELVNNAVTERLSFKKAGQRLEQLAPDADAARTLVAAYEQGHAEPWMTAYLLGCIGHEAGYDTTREILIGGHRQLSESYAGVALALIGGAAAYDDLRSVVFSDAEGKIRRGAAYGMVKLKPPSVFDDLLDAHDQKLLPRSDVASHLSKCGISDGQLLQLLNQGEPRQRLALGVVSSLNYEGCPHPMPGQEVAAAVLRVFQAGTAKTHRLVRQKLLKWAEENA